MRLPSAYSILLGVALVGCKEGEGSALDTYNTSASTSTSSGDGDGDESTSTDESGTEETGDPGPYEGTRYIVTSVEDETLLGINLDDPSSIPDAQTLISGVGPISLFGPTPFEGQIVIHENHLDQLRLRETADYDFTSLATQDAAWLDRVWFGVEAANAIMAVGLTAMGATQQLLWVTYNDAGNVTSSTDITPPIMANGSVVLPDISPDKRFAAVLVDVELDSVWQIYLLNLDPAPNVATYIDQLDLTGLPPTSVDNFIWLDVHENRIAYRKESMPGVFRPYAVALDDPDVNRVNLAPTLSHISSMVWSPDHTKLLVTAGGAPGYRELWLIDVIDATDAQAPLRISEANKDARVNTQGVIDFSTLGHGFDAVGRIWYAYTDTDVNSEYAVGVNLVAVANGDIVQRVELIEPYPGLVVDEVTFNSDLQLLGFRAQSTSFGGSIRHVNLSQANYSIVTIAQDFTHDDMLPEDDVNFAWSADGTRIALVGVQDGMTTMYVSDLADTTGETVEIMLPEIETAPGIVIDHKPRVSPDGKHAVLWYSAQDGRTGLVYAPLDGSVEGQIVLGLQQTLDTGAFLQYHSP